MYDNGWERGDSNPPPTLFAVTRDARGPSARIGCVYHWGGFGRLVEDDAPDLKSNPGDEQATTDAAVEYILAGAPDLMFVHLDHVDGAGHSRGWGSQQYFGRPGPTAPTPFPSLLFFFSPFPLSRARTFALPACP